MGRDDVLSPRQVEGLIAEGGVVLIFEDYVLRLNSWLDRHPGGALAIQHMVGKDATDEILAFHTPASVKPMKHFRIGRKPAGPWPNMTPPIRGGIYRPLGADEKAMALDLHNEVSGADAEAEARALADAVAAKTSVSQQIQPGQLLDDDDACSSSGSSVHEGLSASTCIQRPQDEARLRSRSPAAPGYRDEKGPAVASVTEVDASSDWSEEDEKIILPPRCPIEFTNWAVEQGRDKCRREYPCADDVSLQQDIVTRYRALHQQVKEENLYACPYIEYGKELSRYLTLFGTSMLALHYEWYMTSALFLGMFWHQIMFTAHDAGHRAITGNFTIDTLIGVFIADFCCGLSIGWWKRSHNVHHLITNHPEHDPDIQNVPVFATCPSFFRSISSSFYNGFVFAWDGAANFMCRYQKYTYYPIMAVARFNLYALSWLHVLSSRASSLGGTKAWWIQPTEIFFMICYWFLYGYCLVWLCLPTWWIRIGFVLISHITIMPLHVQINLSHWGMSTSDLGETESFAQRQMRTTMDVDCPPWLDFYHGGLQFQTAHHLFPRVPRHNLRRVQTLAKQFARETKIPYSELTFLDGNKKVLGRLGDVSNQVKVLIRCQQSMADAGEMGLN